MIIIILTAMLRKVIFMGLLFGAWRFVDIFYFRAFDTDVVLKENPIAISILLGLMFLSLALA